MDDKNIVIVKLKKISDDVSEINRHLKEDLELASLRYSEFKSNIEYMKKELSSNPASFGFHHEHTLLPAISEILASSLKANKGSKNASSIGLSMADAGSYVDYWLSEFETSN